MVSPMSAGDLDMLTPTFSNALILSVARPEPCEIMAPAWPILFPSGAVMPAI